ncbi:meteorin-like protein [Electrophorus electricus]|uniref:Meteorin-like protein n=1 Tax=Electrophorus electricus TaxID=8005 RepID=A0A4W4GJB4_ELEEL|nr:meteorin-like protein [Electrophorus electricus]
MLSPFLAYFLSGLVLCRIAHSQYSSDQCSWKGSGLSHEGHTQDVEQVYLRCSQGSLEWLYPTGAVIVNLRPNTAPASTAAAAHLGVCIKPSRESSGTRIYLDRLGELRLLLHERQQAEGHVQCFGIQEGALFIEAVPQTDISRKITAFQYELVRYRPGADPHSLAAPCQPCTDVELLLAVCTNDFVARGSILGVEQGEEQTSVAVTLSHLYRQKSQVFVFGGVRARRWAGHINLPRECGVRPGQGDFLFTGTVRFGEAWLTCGPRYRDFLRVYQEARSQGTNPCHIDTD